MNTLIYILLGILALSIVVTLVLAAILPKTPRKNPERDLRTMDRDRARLAAQLHKCKPFTPEYFALCEAIKDHDQEFMERINHV